MAVLGLCRETVVVAWELHDGDRPLSGGVAAHQGAAAGPLWSLRSSCASFYDQGGGERRWRHVDVGFATCELIADGPPGRLSGRGPTVAAVPWARHDSAFTRAFEDLVVHDAIVGNKQAAADRYGVSWRAVNNMCVRVATEALGRVDLLDGLVAVAIDEVKYKKGQRYLTVVCDHVTGKVVWAAKGRSKDTVNEFFDALGDERSARLQFVTADGASWIRDVVAERAPDAIVCLDTFHVIVVGDRRPRRGPPRRVEPAAPRRRRRGRQGAEGAAVLAAAQLGEPHRRPTRRDPRPPAGEPADVPGLAAERRTARASSPCRCSPPAAPSTTGWPTPPAPSSPRSSSSPAPSAPTGPRSKRPSNGS